MDFSYKVGEGQVGSPPNKIEIMGMVCVVCTVYIYWSYWTLCKITSTNNELQNPFLWTLLITRYWDHCFYFYVQNTIYRYHPAKLQTALSKKKKIDKILPSKGSPLERNLWELSFSIDSVTPNTPTTDPKSTWKKNHALVNILYQY